MLWLRKIFFYVFALIYLVLCPLIVARMLGFVINPLTWRLVKTGLIYVSTNPPAASVHIDGRLSHQKTPTVIRDLAPGEHFIRIELNGYDDWERDIPVVGKKATVLSGILLIPEQWPVKTVSDKPYQNIFLAGDDILIATNAVLKNIDIFNITQGTGQNLFSADSVYADGTLRQVYNEPPSPFILLEATMKDKHKFLWIDPRPTPPVIEDISDLFGQLPDSITWDNADNSNIFAFYPNSVDRINVTGKTVSPEDSAQLPKGLDHPARPPEKLVIDENNDMVTRQGGWIRLYPNENFGDRQSYDIARSKEAAHMYFEEKTGELLFLGDGTWTLRAVQLLPYHTLLNIPVPDALRNKTSMNGSGS